MAEKKLTAEELDRVGLECIEIGWDNRQKLVTLFHHFIEQREPLPASGVNDSGDLVPNLSLLARLGKVIQGKQVFRTRYGRELLDQAIKDSGIEDIHANRDEADEVTVVREKMQETVDSVRRSASVTDNKLQDALAQVRQLTAENEALTEKMKALKQELAVTQAKLGVANERVVGLGQHERITLKRTC